MLGKWSWYMRSVDEVLRMAWDMPPAAVCEEINYLVNEHEEWHGQALNLVASHNAMSNQAKTLLSSGLADNIQSHGIGHRPHSGAIRGDN